MQGKHATPLYIPLAQNVVLREVHACSNVGDMNKLMKEIEKSVYMCCELNKDTVVFI